MPIAPRATERMPPNTIRYRRYGLRIFWGLISDIYRWSSFGQLVVVRAIAEWFILRSATGAKVHSVGSLGGNGVAVYAGKRKFPHHLYGAVPFDAHFSALGLLLFIRIHCYIYSSGSLNPILK